MTDKAKTIHRLNQARTAHIRWINSIKMLISGISNTDSIELTPTESEFGRWYYNEAIMFLNDKPRMVLEDIELLLIALHDKYMKIYPIYNKKKNVFGNLLGSKSKVSEHETELSQRYYEEIIALSDKLKQKIRILESQLMSMNDEKFSVLASFIDSQTDKPTLVSTVAEDESPAENAYFYGTRGR